MTARLNALCALIEKSESFIDVGCDHGYVADYVAKYKLAADIAACDISAPSLEKARRLVGEQAGVRFICADGAVAAKGFATVFVAGLGGKQICAVIDGCAPKTFIVSPQSHVRDVRIRLLMRDYAVTTDTIVRDGRKFYTVLKATLGGGREQYAAAQDVQLQYGMFLHERDDTVAEYIRRQIHILSAYPQTQENIQKLRLSEEALQWQLR